MEDDWIFDSLIGFLRGPVWNVPILTYIEHKSLGNCLFYNPGFARVETVVYNGAALELDIHCGNFQIFRN